MDWLTRAFLFLRDHSQHQGRGTHIIYYSGRGHHQHRTPLPAHMSIVSSRCLADRVRPSSCPAVFTLLRWSTACPFLPLPHQLRPWWCCVGAEGTLHNWILSTNDETNVLGETTRKEKYLKEWTFITFDHLSFIMLSLNTSMPWQKLNWLVSSWRHLELL